MPARSSWSFSGWLTRRRGDLFGGGTGFGTQRGYTNETYLWENDAWVSQSPAALPERDEHAMAWDQTQQAIVVFGGGTGSFTHRESLDDMWLWNGTTWVGGPTGPGSRDGTALAHDGDRQTLALFGGARDGGTWLDDTWAWGGNAWQEISLATRPSARDGHEMVYDPLRDNFVLFGGGVGLIAQRTYSRETWLLRVDCN